MCCRAGRRAKWASTKIEGYLYAASVVQGFKRLFDYISGENEPQVKINMTGMPALAQPGAGGTDLLIIIHLLICGFDLLPVFRSSCCDQGGARRRPLLQVQLHGLLLRAIR